MDAWDVGAGLASLSVIGGVAAVYWPAALILGGVGFLWVYWHREKSLNAPQ